MSSSKSGRDPGKAFALAPKGMEEVRIRPPKGLQGSPNANGKPLVSPRRCCVRRRWSGVRRERRGLPRESAVCPPESKVMRNGGN
jgi:hypothetical protein